ncbi:hypothetical protein ACKI1O_53030, partial [Streptomyces scabiei]
SIVRPSAAKDQSSCASGAAKLLPEAQDDMTATVEEIGLLLMSRIDEEEAGFVEALLWVIPRIHG